MYVTDKTEHMKALLTVLSILLFIGPAAAAQSDADAAYDLGVKLRDQNRLDEAIAKFDEALKLRPDSADIFQARGTTFNWKGDHPKAIADFEKAAELRPQNPEYPLEADLIRMYDAEGLMRTAAKMRLSKNPSAADAAFNAALRSVRKQESRNYLIHYYNWTADCLVQHQSYWRSPPGDFIQGSNIAADSSKQK
jgi:tetratricopeptide (TPR) repeat protein